MFKARLSGVGLWGPGFTNLGQYREMLISGVIPQAEMPTPKPELIPPRERRRAPLMVKLAVEVAEQAARQASIDPSDMHSVFASGIGDADTTDYMCRVLAGPEKLLSPTKFHNSVHNAAAGYWSISTGCERPATFVGGMRNSVSMALIEGMIQLSTENVPVLVVASDLPVPVPMWDMHHVNQTFAAAFVFEPVLNGEPERSKMLGDTDVQSTLMAFSTRASASGRQDISDWPSLDTGKLNSEDAAALQALYRSNPSARFLALVEQLLGIESSMVLPLSDGLELCIDRGEIQQSALSGERYTAEAFDSNIQSSV